MRRDRRSPARGRFDRQAIQRGQVHSRPRRRAGRKRDIEHDRRGQVGVIRCVAERHGAPPPAPIVEPAGALRELVERADGPGERLIPLSGPMVQRRLQAAAVAAGVEHRLTGHSGRVGLASELTARGASTADVMLAGGWKTSRMVAHYAAGATAERGAVARYL